MVGPIYDRMYMNIEQGLVYRALVNPEHKVLKLIGQSIKAELLEFDHVMIDGTVYRMHSIAPNLSVLVEVE